MRRLTKLFFLFSFFILPFQVSALSIAGLTDIAGDKNETAIQWLYNRNIVSGYYDSTYRPKTNINRAELLKILVGAKNINPDANQYKNCFPDVHEEWFARFVCYAKYQGWVEGYTTGSYSGFFRPEQFINKVEAQKMLVNTQGYQIPVVSPGTPKIFNDAEVGTWYYPFLLTAYNKGLLEQQGGNYGIGNFIIRGEISENIYRAMIINLYGLQNFYQYMQSPDPVPPMPPVVYLESTLLKNDLQAQKIATSSINFDLNNPELYSLPRSEYVKSLPYKLSVALHMIGYQNGGDLSLQSFQTINTLLQKFQQNNGFPVSTLLKSEVLGKLDQELYKKEQQIAGYSKKAGTIFESISPSVLQSQFSKDYIGWIFNFPFENLPSNLIQKWTPSNYFICIYSQCVGSLSKADGSMYQTVGPETYLQGNFIFSPDIFPNISESVEAEIRFQKSSSMVAAVLHEFAHYLDGNGNYSKPELNFKIINTTEFKKISFLPDNSGYFSSCAKRKTNDVKSFITRYGFDGANGVPCKDLGAEYGAPFEDFAESFTAYVLAGKVFREAAKQNSDLQKKYIWLKTNVFSGQEYDTNLAYGRSYAYAGCSNAKDTDSSGGPFYISCNNDFVWDGTIKSP